MAFQERNYIFYFFILIIFTVFPVTALISTIIYFIVYPFSLLFPNYGKFISYFDVWMDEDFVDSIPQSSIVTSLTLQGDLSLEELRTLFIENVLTTRSKVDSKKLRYPELQQYLTTFICFRIWKNDPSFLIENHIVEKNWNGSDLGNIHQKYQNKMYKKRRSPWKLVLFRNVNFDNDNEKGPKSLLVLRTHHAMADAKSLLKLLVECLGKKEMKTANAQGIEKTKTTQFLFALNYPWKCIRQMYKLIRLLCDSFDHPWKLDDCIGKPDYEKNKTMVEFSGKIQMSKVKLVAKQNDVKTSAVVMSMIAGTIRKYCGDKWDKEVMIGYPLPKPNHPECLTNHTYMGLVGLATGEQCAVKRLQMCNEEFVKVKEDQLVRYTNVGTFLAGIQMYPMSRLIFNPFGPIGIYLFSNKIYFG